MRRKVASVAVALGYLCIASVAVVWTKSALGVNAAALLAVVLIGLLRVLLYFLPTRESMGSDGKHHEE